ncbi:hypothetical protein [Streptomyces orinoci]|uniref:Nucleopolyhedrovirus P10 family protein n=1 Tax=Streptomyces orinoci TaxID=67339 RepID=A0ABV3K0J3_STRON|nr:hypothetical protein [Streptomyces orinoci]
MDADALATAVQRQLALGRLLPLGGAADGAWITEAAAADALRRAAARLRGIRLGELRLAPAERGTACAPAVPPPPSALPPGPLRIEAELAVKADQPLRPAAERLRARLLQAARDGLGLAVRTVDLRVTGLLDAPAGRAPVARRPSPAPPGEPDHPALSVPGVARLAPVLGLSPGDEAHQQVQIAVADGFRALDVALAVRRALTTGPVRTVAVVVTATGTR